MSWSYTITGDARPAFQSLDVPLQEAVLDMLEICATAMTRLRRRESTALSCRSPTRATTAPWTWRWSKSSPTTRRRCSTSRASGGLYDEQRDRHPRHRHRRRLRRDRRRRSRRPRGRAPAAVHAGGGGDERRRRAAVPGARRGVAAGGGRRAAAGRRPRRRAAQDARYAAAGLRRTAAAQHRARHAARRPRRRRDDGPGRLRGGDAAPRRAVRGRADLAAGDGRRQRRRKDRRQPRRRQEPDRQLSPALGRADRPGDAGDAAAARAARRAWPSASSTT